MAVASNNGTTDRKHSRFSLRQVAEAILAKRKDLSQESPRRTTRPKASRNKFTTPDPSAKSHLNKSAAMLYPSAPQNLPSSNVTGTGAQNQPAFVLTLFCITVVGAALVAIAIVVLCALWYMSGYEKRRSSLSGGAIKRSGLQRFRNRNSCSGSRYGRNRSRNSKGSDRSRSKRGERSEGVWCINMPPPTQGVANGGNAPINLEEKRWAGHVEDLNILGQWEASGHGKPGARDSPEKIGSWWRRLGDSSEKRGIDNVLYHVTPPEKGRDDPRGKWVEMGGSKLAEFVPHDIEVKAARTRRKPAKRYVTSTTLTLCTPIQDGDNLGAQRVGDSGKSRAPYEEIGGSWNSGNHCSSGFGSSSRNGTGSVSVGMNESSRRLNGIPARKRKSLMEALEDLASGDVSAMSGYRLPLPLKQPPTPAPDDEGDSFWEKESGIWTGSSPYLAKQSQPQPQPDPSGKNRCCDQLFNTPGPKGGDDGQRPFSRFSQTRRSLQNYDGDGGREVLIDPVLLYGGIPKVHTTKHSLNALPQLPSIPEIPAFRREAKSLGRAFSRSGRPAEGTTRKYRRDVTVLREDQLFFGPETELRDVPKDKMAARLAPSTEVQSVTSSISLHDIDEEWRKVVREIQDLGND